MPDPIAGGSGAKAVGDPAGRPALSWLAAIIVAALYLVLLALGVLSLALVQIRSLSGPEFDAYMIKLAADEDVIAALPATLDAAMAQKTQNDFSITVSATCLTYFDGNGKVSVDLVGDAGIRRRIEEVLALPTPPDPSQEANPFVQCALRGLTQVKDDLNYFKSQSSGLQQQIAELRDAMATAKEDMRQLQKQTAAETNRLLQERTFGARLSRLPTEILILGMVMLMGALGGMLRIMRDFVGEKTAEPALRDYILVPTTGFMIGIAGYVMARAGLLLLSSSKNDVALSPYMISLVGIVSGVVAQDVIDAIARQGKKMFGEKEEPAAHPPAPPP